MTLTVQFAPMATVASHVLLWEKSPLAVIPEIESGALPILVTVTSRAALDVPTACVPKLSREGKNAGKGALSRTDIAGVALKSSVTNTRSVMPSALKSAAVAALDVRTKNLGI